MKRKKMIFATALLVAVSISFQSCIGSFSLTNKVLSWNKNVNNKFVNELVFFAFWVLPVYEVTAIADLLVINSIEFWSGTNPMEANNQVIETENGKYYIASDENGYDITSPDGQKLCFIFNSETKTWSIGVNDADPIDFLKFTDPSHVQILDATGDFVDVELSREGVEEYTAMIGAPLMARL